MALSHSRLAGHQGPEAQFATGSLAWLSARVAPSAWCMVLIRHHNKDQVAKFG